MPEEQKTIIQMIYSKLKILIGKRDLIEEISPELETAIPKDLSPEDVIKLFDLKDNEIPALIDEGFKGVPDHIQVLNEVHLENATPKEFKSQKKD